jgi:hypothetical protein
MPPCPEKCSANVRKITHDASRTGTDRPAEPHQRQGSPMNRAPYAAQRAAPPRPVRRLRFLTPTRKRQPGQSPPDGSRRAITFLYAIPHGTAPRTHQDQDVPAAPKRPRDSGRDPSARRWANGVPVAPASARPTTRSSSSATMRSLSRRGAARHRTVLARLQLTPTAELDEKRKLHAVGRSPTCA